MVKDPVAAECWDTGDAGYCSAGLVLEIGKDHKNQKLTWGSGAKWDFPVDSDSCENGGKSSNGVGQRLFLEQVQGP
eukprot:9873164-Prorocentrum_lima.AAC.1